MKEPIVLCLTNTVAANFTANCLLAIGARPAMIEESEEIEEFAQIADALLVNLGTVIVAQAALMRKAIAFAGKHRLPWVLDPVGVQITGYRRRLVAEFLVLHPSVIRGNHAEIEVVRELENSAASGAAMLSTGGTDRVYPSAALPPTEITGGTALLQAVTATGCAQGGIAAAMLGRGLAPFEAALAASKLMKRAGELAFTVTGKPGGFQAALLDALWETSHD